VKETVEAAGATYVHRVVRSAAPEAVGGAAVKRPLRTGYCADGQHSQCDGTVEHLHGGTLGPCECRCHITAVVVSGEGPDLSNLAPGDIVPLGPYVTVAQREDAEALALLRTLLDHWDGGTLGVMQTDATGDEETAIRMLFSEVAELVDERVPESE